MVKSLRSVFGFLYPKMEPTNKKDWVALLSNSIVEGNQSINQNNNLERKIRKNIAYWLMLNLPTWLIYLFIKPRITCWVMVPIIFAQSRQFLTEMPSYLGNPSIESSHTHTHFLKVYLIVFQPSHGLSSLLSSQSLPCNTIFSIPHLSHQLFVLRKRKVFHGCQQNTAYQASLRQRTSPSTGQGKVTL